MESDDLKSLWEAYDKKLDRNLQFNENLLRKMNLDKAKRELNMPLTLEVLNMIAHFFFALYLIIVSWLIFEQLHYSIPGFIAAGATLTLLGISIIKARKLFRMDYYENTVLKLLQQIYDLQSFKYRIGRAELILGIIALIAMWPLVLITGFEIDIYANIWPLIIAVTIASIIALPLAIRTDRYYRKKLKNTTSLLEEIQELEN